MALRGGVSVRGRLGRAGTLEEFLRYADGIDRFLDSFLVTAVLLRTTFVCREGFILHNNIIYCYYVDFDLGKTLLFLKSLKFHQKCFFFAVYLVLSLMTPTLRIFYVHTYK